MRPCAAFIPGVFLSRQVLAGLLTVWLVLPSPRAAHAAPGDLDPTFGVGGKVSTDFGGTGNWATALVVQPDGKLVAAGSSAAAGLSDFALARYNANGSLDSTFGVGGKVITDFGGLETAYALVVQPDGKLVAAGFSQTAGHSDFALARYNANGSLDSTFGVGGKVITNFAAPIDWAYALVVQPDGKLVAAGFSAAAGASNFALARYNTNGSLDSTFGEGTGKVTTDFGGPIDWATALVVQPDGKLVAAGSSAAAGLSDFALARYNANGSLDSTFGVGGKVITDFGGLETATALVVQPDGKLVAAGYMYNGETYDFALARYNTNGSLDSTFGEGTGKVTTDFGSEAKALTLVLQPDGKLVAAGYASADDADNFALVRYNANGNMDSTFGVGGKVITDFGGPDDLISALIVQPDGKLVAAGSSAAAGASNFALARYNANGSLDSTFGEGTGKVITDFGGPDDLISALIVQPDGKLVAAGSSGANFALARYQGGGTAATRTLTVTRTGAGSDPGGSEQRTFLTTDPITGGATYYDSNETCAGANPVTLKFFVFNLEGQLILGRNRDTTGGVTNTQIGGSKYQALLATLAPGTLSPGAYNLVFMVEDCTATAVLVSGFYSIQVFTP